MNKKVVDIKGLRRQLGDSVTINGKNIFDNYSADFINMEYTPANEKYNFHRHVGGHMFVVNNYTRQNANRTLRFYVGGESLEEAQINVNKLFSDMSGQFVLKVDDTEFEYSCVTTGKLVEYTGVDYYYLVTVTADVIKRYGLVGRQFNQVNKTSYPIQIWNSGVAPSGINIIIKASGDFGVTFYDGDKKIYRTVSFVGLDNAPLYYKIGGLDGTVQCADDNEFQSNVSNVFGKTNLIVFPQVQPGFNEITITQANIGTIGEIEIQFYPTFIM